ncbi:MAG: hypothetical protein M0Q87_02570 [Ottowia sp.]|nr:hypothetical protein [Ottowia sp.]
MKAAGFPIRVACQTFSQPPLARQAPETSRAATRTSVEAAIVAMFAQSRQRKSTPRRIAAQITRPNTTAST